MEWWLNYHKKNWMPFVCKWHCNGSFRVYFGFEYTEFVIFVDVDVVVVENYLRQNTSENNDLNLTED